MNNNKGCRKEAESPNLYNCYNGNNPLTAALEKAPTKTWQSGGIYSHKDELIQLPWRVFSLLTDEYISYKLGTSTLTRKM